MVMSKITSVAPRLTKILGINIAADADASGSRSFSHSRHRAVFNNGHSNTSVAALANSENAPASAIVLKVFNILFSILFYCTERCCVKQNDMLKIG